MQATVISNLSAAGAKRVKHQTCVALRESLQAVGYGGRTIDLLSIDIEGSEPNVFRCLPFDELNIRAIIIETNKNADLRPVDAFFHAHGYANVASFGVGNSILDNLYIRMQEGSLTYPAGEPTCGPAVRRYNPWCKSTPKHFMTDARNGGWGACDN